MPASHATASAAGAALLPVMPDGDDLDRMTSRAEEAAAFLKALSHEGRLMILCHLARGERSVSELEALLGSRQAAVSQQLARLRLEGLVACRREGKQIYYSLQDARVVRTIGLMYEMFCADGD
ncbi:MAG: ArsR/SmtB family transcription factor [Gemmobacter sp.]